MELCHRLLTLPFCLLLFSAASLPAVDSTWTGSSNTGDWTDVNNWDDDTNPGFPPGAAPGMGDTVTFNSAGGTDDIIEVDGITITKILIDLTADAYTFGSGLVGADTLTLDDGGSIEVTSAVMNDQLVNANLNIQNATLTNASTTNSLTIEGVIDNTGGSNTLGISGGGSIIINGDITQTAGTLALDVLDNNTTLTLRGDNNFSGGFGATDTSAFFTVIVGSNTAFGIGTIQSQGIRFQAENNLINIGNDITVGPANGGFRVDGDNNIQFSGTITNNANRTWENSGSGTVTISNTLDTGSFTTTLDGGSWNFSGVITGSGGSLNMSGGAADTVTLSGANTYTGFTRLEVGTIIADAADVLSTSGALGNGGQIQFRGGTLQFTANSAVVGTDYSSRIQSGTSAIRLDTNSQDVTFLNALDGSNTGGLIKSGAGDLTLGAGNLYTGNTTITEGSITLSASESILDSSSFQIDSGASLNLGGFTETINGLSGAGSVTGAGTLNVGSAGGTISPGDGGIGVLTVDGNLSFGSTSISTFEYDGNAGAGMAGGHDQISVTGASRTVNLDGIFNFNPSVAVTDPFTLIDLVDASSTLNGTFSNLQEGSPVNGGTDLFTFTYAGGTDNNDLAVIAGGSNIAYWKGGTTGTPTGWQTASNWFADVGETAPFGGIPDSDDIIVFRTDAAINSTIHMNSTARAARSIVVLSGANTGTAIIRGGGGLTGTALTLTDTLAIQMYSDGTQTGRILSFNAGGASSEPPADLFFASGAGSTASILVQGSTDRVRIRYDIDDAPSDAATTIAKNGAGTLELGGPRANGFTGDWIVTEGALELNKADNVTAIAGNLTFSPGSGILTISADEQLSNTSNVVFNGTQIFLAGGTENTVNSFTANTGIIDFLGTSELQFLSNSLIDSNVRIEDNAIFRVADGVTLTLNGDTSNLGAGDLIQFFVGESGTANVTGLVNTGTGDGGLLKGGTGTLTLSNDGSGYGGVTQLDEGVTEFTSIANYNAKSSLGDGNNNGTFSVIQIGSSASAATLKMIGDGDLNTSNRNFELGDMGGTIEVFDPTQILDLSGVFANRDTSGSLTKSGAGTLRLSGTNTYSGNTTLSAGITQAGSNGAFGPTGTVTLINTDTELRLEDGITISNDITIDDTGDNKVIRVNSGSATLSGTITTNETGTEDGGFLGNFDLEATNAGNTLTVSGPITGPGVVNTTGDGTVVLTQANNFSGNFFLGDGGSSTDDINDVGAAQGFVQFSNGDAFGTGTIIGRGSQLRSTIPDLVIPNAFTLEGGALRLGGSNNFEIAGQITPVGSGRDIGHYGLTGRTFTLSGGLNLTNEIRVRGSTAGNNGTLLITGDIIGGSQFTTNADFSGGNVIFTGSNSYGSTNIGANTTIEVGNGGSTGTLGGGAVTNNGALIFNRDNDYTASNVISGGGTVTQRGTGRTILTGANTYSGATTIENGRLDIGGSLTMSSVVVNDSAAIGGEGTISASLTFGSPGTTNSFLIFDGTTTEVLTVGTLDTQNGVTIDFADGNGPTSDVIDVVTYTTAWNNTSGTMDFTLGTTIQASARGSASVNDTGMGGTPGTIQLILPYETRTWDGDEANSTWWDIGTTANWQQMPDELFQDLDFVVFDDTASVGGGAGAVTVQLRSNVAPSSAAFNNAGRAYTLNDNGGGETLSTTGGVAFNGAAGVNINVEITGSGGVTQTDGTTVFSVNNSYTGATTLSGGTLQVGTGAGAGTVGSGEIVFAGGTIAINRNNSATFANNISGAGGTFNQTGSGTTIVTGTNTSNAATNITNGTLQIGNGGAGGGIGGGDIEVNNATLVINTTTGIVHSSDFDFFGATNMLNVQAGSHVFNGANGNVDVRGSTTWSVDSGASVTIGTNNNSNIGFGGTPTLTLDGTGTGRIERTIASGDADGTVVKEGSGTWTLARTNPEGTGWSTGGLVINNGTIVAGADNVVPYNGAAGEEKGNLSITNPGTFDAAGTTQNVNGITGNGTYDNTSATASSLTIGHENTDSTFAGVIQNSGGGDLSVTKLGNGTLTLEGNSTYTGTTTVSAGTLIVDGNNSLATGAVTVDAGATLGGSGTIGGNTTISGIHEAGSTTGTMGTDFTGQQTFSGNLDYSGGASTVTWDLINSSSSVAGTDFDQFVINGTLSFSAATELNLRFNSTGSTVDWVNDTFWDSDQQWTIYDGTTDLTGLIGNLTLGAFGDLLDSQGNRFNPTLGPQGASFALGLDSMDNTNIVLTFTAVPEPSTFALMGLGLAGFGWFIRRRRKLAVQEA